MRKLINIPVTPESHASITREATRSNVSTSNYILFALFGDEDVQPADDNSAADTDYDADKANYNNGRPLRLHRSRPGEARTSYLAFRVTEAQHSRLRHDARKEGMTANAYITQALMLPLTD